MVNGPGEARETDIGLTGGGKGTHQIYVSGLADHRLTNGDVEHVVDLVEARRRYQGWRDPGKQLT